MRTIHPHTPHIETCPEGTILATTSLNKAWLKHDGYWWQTGNPLAQADYELPHKPLQIIHWGKETPTDG